MDQALIALLGAAIGAIAAITGSVITNMVAVRNENARQRESRHAAYVAALRKEAAAAFAEIYIYFSAIEVVCFFAKNDPDAIDAAMVKRYHDTIAATDPRMMAAIATVAGLNVRLYDELRPISRSLQKLDDTVCAALRDLLDDRPRAVSALAECHASMVELDDFIPAKIAEVMRAAECTAEGE